MTNLFRMFTIPLILMAVSQGAAHKSSLPPQGIIPDEVTAVRVAEAVLPPIFGQEEVTKYFPYHAQLNDEVWKVYGTLKPGARGGTPQLSIQKKDGKVLAVWHSQ